MAALTIVSIFAFVFSGLFYSSGRGGGSDPVAVTTTKFGNLRRSELDELQRQRHQLFEVVRAFADAMQPDEKLPLTTTSAVCKWSLKARFGPATMEGAVNSWLFSKQGEAMSIQVTDKSINEFILRAITESRLTQQQQITDALLLTPAEEAFRRVNCLQFCGENCLPLGQSRCFCRCGLRALARRDNGGTW